MSNNLQYLRDTKGLNKREMAKLLAVNEGNYGKMEKGELNISANVRISLEREFPEYSIDWIINNKGDKFKKDLPSAPNITMEELVSRPDFWNILAKAKEIQDSKKVNSSSFEDESNDSPFIDLGNGQYNMLIPLVEQTAQAGFVNGWKDAEYISELPKHSIIVDRFHRGKYYAFRVVGDSMEDGTIGSIPERSIVTGREIKQDLWRSKFHITKFKYYVIVHQDGIMVKQIIDHDTELGKITCHSLNPVYQDFDLNLDDIKMILNIVNISIPS